MVLISTELRFHAWLVVLNKKHIQIKISEVSYLTTYRFLSSPDKFQTERRISHKHVYDGIAVDKSPFYTI